MKAVILINEWTGSDACGALDKMSWPLAADAHLRGLCATRVARPR